MGSTSISTDMVGVRISTSSGVLPASRVGLRVYYRITADGAQRENPRDYAVAGTTDRYG